MRTKGRNYGATIYFESQMDKENKLILYKDDEGKVNVNVRFADEDVWLTRENLAEIYATTPQNISLHTSVPLKFGTVKNL